MIWRNLRHPNILRLIGVTMTKTQFAMVSDWMENGNINEFVKANPDTNRLELVCFPFKVSPSSPYAHELLDNFSSWEMSLGG